MTDMSTTDQDLIQSIGPAIQSITDERIRQVLKEDYSFQHDDNHVEGEIADFAAYYAMTPETRELKRGQFTIGETILPGDWVAKPCADRRRELVKAGALIVAEIERIDRAKERETTS